MNEEMAVQNTAPNMPTRMRWAVCGWIWTASVWTARFVTGSTRFAAF